MTANTNPAAKLSQTLAMQRAAAIIAAGPRACIPSTTALPVARPKH